MFSIQKWFARDDRFFELLRASAAEGQAAVQTLKQILLQPSGQPRLDEFAAVRRREKQVSVQIAELLARTSITALDREDIEAIYHVLHKIPKTAEKVAARYAIGGASLGGIDFTRQVDLISQAMDTVASIIQELEKSHFGEVNACNERLQTIEGEADKLMIHLLTELYSGKYPSITVTIAKDIYELLERMVDRCRDVGNVVANVVLKHS
ncbi:MAG TPA: DUF47 family protein [Verrucomicrobiae bacterium]|jgi:hypothetical protein|nr:DUF47 family protein [Verrucomicrobiae bacterium]